MLDQEKNEVICKSIFKNGKTSTSTIQFTQKWIELINEIEKRKAINHFQNSR